jgi:hypothetical protein
MDSTTRLRFSVSETPVREPQLRLDRPPTWTRADNTRPERPPDDITTYGDFVSDVVTHFKGQVHYYQIWNEPNIQYWQGTPEEFFKLYDYTADAVKRALPTAKIGERLLGSTT